MNVRQICHELTTNSFCRILFSTRCETSKEFIETDFDDFFKYVENLIQLLSTFNLSDLIPLLRPFDLQGVEKQMKHAFDKMKKQVARILKEYKKGNKMIVNSNVKDFVEILLSLDEKLDDTTIKSLMVVCPYPKLFCFNKMYASYILYFSSMCGVNFSWFMNCRLVCNYRICLVEGIQL